MIVKNELNHMPVLRDFSIGNGREDHASQLFVNLKDIINTPDDMSFIENKLNGYSFGSTFSHATIIDLPKDVIRSPPSPTPSDTPLTVDLNAYNRPDTIIRIPFDIDPPSKPSALKRHAKNTGLTISRNLVSVAIPTALREYVRRALLPTLFNHFPDYVAPTFSGITAGLPIALQLFGIARDIYRGTQTTETLRARIASSLLVLGTTSALVATGGLSVAANALIASVFVYVPVRDILQYFVMLTDNNKEEFLFSPSVKAAASYAGNQFLVDYGMDLLSDALTPLMGSIAAQMLGRAIMNTAGETGDELAMRGFMANTQQNPELVYNLQLRRPENISLESIVDHIANTLTSRACIFSASYACGFSLPFTGFLNSMLVGVAMSFGYVPFVYAHAQKEKEKAIDDMEAGRLPA